MVFLIKPSSLRRMSSLEEYRNEQLLIANLSSPLMFTCDSKTFFEKGMFFSPYVYSVDSLLENIG